MSRRNKLVKFTDLLTFPNVYECFEPAKPNLSCLGQSDIELKGKWASQHFKNEKEIILELACGHGDYSLALAQRYPDKNIIGVDIKGARIWKGASYALENKIDNLAFLRSKIEVIDNFFGSGEISEIWITFPDPFLKESKMNRRLTSSNFLTSYKTFLKPGGLINVKTDSPEFYAHTKGILTEEKIDALKDSFDIYKDDVLIHPDLDIKTYYEKKHLKDGRLIKFIQFKLDSLKSKSKIDF